MAIYFKNTEKEIIMDWRKWRPVSKKNFCRFCEKGFNSDKVRDHCDLTGKNRGPAHNNCNINVKQKQNSFSPFIFHNFSNFDCHMFFKK